MSRSVSAAAGTALILNGCAGAGQSRRQSANQPPAKGAEDEKGGEDGYEDAVKQIADIEGGLGLSDISQFTAPRPPKVAGA